MSVPAPAGFRVVRPLGTGSSASVFLGQDDILGRLVALKQVTAVDLDAAAVRDLAVHEGRALARLSSPFIAQVYDVVPNQGGVWLVEEYVSGRSVQQLLDDQAEIPRSRASLWIDQVAAALATAHAAGVVHCDLKPANIIIDRDWNARLVDFGVARLQGGTSRRIDRMISGAGTPAYMSPEQVRRENGAVSDRSDMYALGVIGYQLILGQHPFVERTGSVEAMMGAHVSEQPVAPRTLDRTVGRRASALVLSCLAKQPQERPSAATFRKQWHRATR